MLIPAGSKILMVGDSITDSGRVRPVGKGVDGLGNGYVSLVDSLLTATYPSDEFTVINMGVSGNTLKDLSARWQTDVLNLQPDWLSVMIGINDVGRQFDAPGLHRYPQRRNTPLSLMNYWNRLPRPCRESY